STRMVSIVISRSQYQQRFGTSDIGGSSFLAVGRNLQPSVFRLHRPLEIQQRVPQVVHERRQVVAHAPRFENLLNSDRKSVRTLNLLLQPFVLSLQSLDAVQQHQGGLNGQRQEGLNDAPLIRTRRGLRGDAAQLLQAVRCQVSHYDSPRTLASTALARSYSGQ